MSEPAPPESLRVVLHGRAGHLEFGGLRFPVELQAAGPGYAIWFPRRELDRTLARARDAVLALVAREAGKWELIEFDSAHGLYAGLPLAARLAAAGLADDYATAADPTARARILREVEIDEREIARLLNGPAF